VISFGNSTQLPSPKPAGLGLVFPRDAEQIQRIDVLRPDLQELLLNLRRHQLGILLLRERRQDDAPLLGALDGPAEDVVVDLGNDFHAWFSPLGTGVRNPENFAKGDLESQINWSRPEKAF
jgi:hypothetical protein